MSITSTDTIINMEYFLGANTGKGFNSLFGQAYDPFDGWRVWIIKGGPGTGKSTAMKRAVEKAEELGLPCELCRCSSDPGSLDAVLVPELKRAVFDGTAPHVMEPRLCGACENIVNFGEAWDAGTLYHRRGDIAALGAECSAYHTAAQRWLRAADAFRENTRRMAAQSVDRDKIGRAAGNIAGKILGRTGRARASYAAPETRLFTAVTPRGVIMPGAPHIGMLANRAVISDRTGAVSELLLDRLVWLLSDGGIKTVKGVCSQSGRTEHVYAPGLSFIISVSNDFHDAAGNYRVIHSERFLTKDYMKEQRSRIRMELTAAKEMIDNAVREMAKAKAVHDRLEQIYIEAMDYEKVDIISQRLVRDMFE